MKRLGAINLPQAHKNEYDKQLSVMLYQYLSDIHLQINTLQAEVSAASSTSYMLLEDGSYMLLEDGSRILLE